LRPLRDDDDDAEANADTTDPLPFLEDARTLESYSVSNGATLQLSIAPALPGSRLARVQCMRPAVPSPSASSSLSPTASLSPDNTASSNTSVAANAVELVHPTFRECIGIEMNAARTVLFACDSARHRVVALRLPFVASSSSSSSSSSTLPTLASSSSILSSALHHASTVAPLASARAASRLTTVVSSPHTPDNTSEAAEMDFPSSARQSSDNDAVTALPTLHQPALPCVASFNNPNRSSKPTSSTPALASPSSSYFSSHAADLLWALDTGLAYPRECRQSAHSDRLLFCTDCHHHRVVVVDTLTGQPLGAWGERGDDAGQFQFPWSLAFGSTSSAATPTSPSSSSSSSSLPSFCFSESSSSSATHLWVSEFGRDRLQCFDVAPYIAAHADYLARSHSPLVFTSNLGLVQSSEDDNDEDEQLSPHHQASFVAVSAPPLNVQPALLRTLVLPDASMGIAVASAQIFVSSAQRACVQIFDERTLALLHSVPRAGNRGVCIDASRNVMYVCLDSGRPGTSAGAGTGTASTSSSAGPQSATDALTTSSTAVSTAFAAMSVAVATSASSSSASLPPLPQSSSASASTMAPSTANAASHIDAVSAFDATPPFAHRGTVGRLTGAYGVCVDSAGGHIYVTERWNSAINVFAAF
jgi:hypothetical protein